MLKCNIYILANCINGLSLGNPLFIHPIQFPRLWFQKFLFSESQVFIKCLFLLSGLISIYTIRKSVLSATRFILGIVPGHAW